MQMQAKWFKSGNTNGKPECNSSDKKHHCFSNINNALKKVHYNQVNSNKEKANNIDKFNCLLASSSNSSSDKDEKRST
eukprot:835006-Ditylum_brightwellii.AAC.1